MPPPDQPAVAFVTGTSRGLGAAIARALLDTGWSVVGIARRAAHASLTGDRPTGSAAYTHYRLDLADLDATARLFEEELAERADLASARRVGLVNNAAVLDFEATDEIRLEHVARSLSVNAAVPTWLMGWCLRHTPPSTPLRIVNISSGAASTPYPGWSSYCASKAALEMAGQVLAEELAERTALAGRDVAVISYAPGVVATDMQAAIRAADEGSFPRRARFEELHERGDLVSPDRPAAEVARLMLRNDLAHHTQYRYSEAASQG